MPATAAYPAICTAFECWRRRVANGKIEVVEAMEGEGVHAPPHNRPASVTTTTTTLSKEKTHLHQLHVPYLECLKKKKAKELR
jgi:hypothetical protein